MLGQDVHDVRLGLVRVYDVYLLEFNACIRYVSKPRKEINDILEDPSLADPSLQTFDPKGQVYIHGFDAYLLDEYLRLVIVLADLKLDRHSSEYGQDLLLPLNILLSVVILDLIVN